VNSRNRIGSLGSGGLRKGRRPGKLSSITETQILRRGLIGILPILWDINKNGRLLNGLQIMSGKIELKPMRPGWIGNG
jgi:hypothetical protein